MRVVLFLLGTFALCQAAPLDNFTKLICTTLGVKAITPANLKSLAPCIAKELIPCSGMTSDTDRLMHLMKYGLPCGAAAFTPQTMSALMGNYSTLDNCLTNKAKTSISKLVAAIQASTKPSVTKMRTTMKNFWAQFKTWNTSKLSKAAIVDKEFIFGCANIKLADINAVIKDLIETNVIGKACLACFLNGGKSLFNMALYPSAKLVPKAP